jgi:hypothetical protein
VPYVERFQKAFASASKDVPGTTVTPSSSSVHSGSVVVLSAARASLGVVQDESEAEEPRAVQILGDDRASKSGRPDRSAEVAERALKASARRDGGVRVACSPGAQATEKLCSKPSASTRTCGPARPR